MLKKILIQKAKDFATEAHRDQKRKYTGEPYITHPIEVMEIVRTVPHCCEMLEAALLHDVVEDTAVTQKMIELLFGDGVGRFVYHLTDPELATSEYWSKMPEKHRLNRKQRQKIKLAHLSHAPTEVKTIKLADMISNLTSIAKHDPKFAKVYIVEAREQLEFLQDGDPTLLKEVEEILTVVEDALK